MCKKINILLIWILSLSACSIKEHSDFLQHTISIKGKIIEMNCFVGRPHEIVCSGDFLMFSDHYENKVLTVYDTKAKQCMGRFLSVGSGPGELVVPIRLFVTSEKELGVFQPQTRDLYFFKSTDMNFQHKISFNNMSSRIQKTQNYFIGSGVYEKGRISIFDDSGNAIQYVGDYPFDGNNMEVIERYIIYQGYICTCPTNDFFAICSELCDNLEFYEIKDNSGILIKKYETFDVDAQFQNRRLIDEKTRIAYRGAYGTEKYCYLLYSGKSEEEAKKKPEKYIIVFDWRGNHIKTYQLDVDVVSFCVNENNDTIYGIVLKEEFEIMSFDL